MAYSTETGQKNIGVLVDGLKLVQESGASVIFENENLFILSPSVQNESGAFDVNIVNIEKARESNKRAFLVIRYHEKLLVGSLEAFLKKMTSSTFMYTNRNTRKWTYRVREQGERYYVTLSRARGLEFNLTVKNDKELINYCSSQIVNGNSKVKELTIDLKSADSLIRHIDDYIKAKGFSYSLENIKNLYLSIRSKPFVIISGISGTGKTKIVQLFAESIGATEENNQFKLIPVRPDWSDSSELLGYRDIKGVFIKGPLIKIVEEAINNPKKPHFVLLDEMNLARVEYYFSDILSVLESRRREGEGIITSYLLDEKIEGQRLRLPENLIIIGTVNMDETTHPFSKKVLDRANAIEFNEVNLESFSHLDIQEEVSAQSIDHKEIATNYISLKDVYESHKQLIRDISKKLAEINKQLEPLNAHVGYRVRDEICFYMIHNKEHDLVTENEAFDFCIMQKILPRITGGDERVLSVLTNLLESLTGQPYEMEEVIYSTQYPRSVRKIEEMLRGYYADGFTSFWIT